MWTLKPNHPPFEMVDGPLAGRAYRHGQQYAEIPEAEAYRFEHSGETIISGMAANDAAKAEIAEASPAQGRKNRKLTEEASHAE